MSEGSVKKVFFVVGELPGDRVVAWYITKRFGTAGGRSEELVCQGIGGNQMLNVGVELYARFETLNVTGIIEIIKHLPRLLRQINNLALYIKQQGFDEVILVDFPGSNLRLAQRLRSIIPSLTITYASPPQLWCWGAWRIKKLKRYCDQIVVMYPFEVDWYKQRGVNATWLGSPVYETLKPYYIDAPVEKKQRIALLIGSRKQEIEKLTPIFAQCLKLLAKRFPEVTFVIPLAASIDDQFIHEIFVHEGLCKYRSRIIMQRGEENKIKLLQTCCCALSKPGTVTLELALLNIPTIIVYRTSWLTYLIARALVSVRWMGLPNLLMKREVFKEHVQHLSNPDLVVASVSKLYTSFTRSGQTYKDASDVCSDIKDLLSGNE
jgi:lipid-A-disaccharide synthase